MPDQGRDLNLVEYYTFDIVGLHVFDSAGNALGVVKDVLKTGSNDVYVASKPGEAAQILIPALKKVVKEINLTEGRMVVDLPAWRWTDILVVLVACLGFFGAVWL